MNLSADLISQFAKITNDGAEREPEEKTMYGEIVQFGDTLCVRFDGSEEVTPAITTSTIKAGDRVSAVIKNHTAVVTGNFSDPAASSDDLSKVGFKITEMGVVFTGLADGTTTINGACIKTGTIDADRINLTGSITFSDLNSDVQNRINSAGSLPGYINYTHIGPTKIESPEIYGNNMTVSGTFRTLGSDGLVKGYMGSAKGKTREGQDTYGVAMSYKWSEDDYSVSDKYVIVTDGGVRLQAGSNKVVVTELGVFLDVETGVAMYNGQEIATGSGGGGDVTVTAVWG